MPGAVEPVGASTGAALAGIPENANFMQAAAPHGRGVVRSASLGTSSAVRPSRAANNDRVVYPRRLLSMSSMDKIGFEAGSVYIRAAQLQLPLLRT